VKGRGSKFQRCISTFRRPVCGQGMAQHPERTAQPRVDAFRNFREKEYSHMRDGEGPTGLAKLYEPLLDVIFWGTFDRSVIGFALRNFRRL
jgi:hypothetical protein